MKDQKREPRLPARELIPPDQHPVFRHKYTVITPMIERIYGEIVRWIRNGIPGGYVQGPSRLGKTKLRRFLALALPLQIPRVVIYTMTAHKYDHPSENVFFADLLRATKHAMAKSGTSAQKRDRLTEGMVGAAGASGQDRIILIIDQAHRMLDLHFDWLVDLYEDLDDRGVELFVLLIGEPSLTSMYEEFRRSGQMQIIGRFMAGQIEFTGIRRKADLRACLDCYDQKSRFPENTDWTFSRYYLPDAFSGGWRLTNHAAAFWSAFEEVYRSAACTGAMEIPMQFFARAVDRFLLEASAAGGRAESISQAQLVQFVRDTKIVEVIRGKISSRKIDFDRDETDDDPVDEAETEDLRPKGEKP